MPTSENLPLYLGTLNRGIYSIEEWEDLGEQLPKGRVYPASQPSTSQLEESWKAKKPTGTGIVDRLRPDFNFSTVIQPERQQEFLRRSESNLRSLSQNTVDRELRKVFQDAERLIQEKEGLFEDLKDHISTLIRI